MFLVGSVVDFITHTHQRVNTEINHEALNRAGKLIGSIDQGTSSTRFMVFSERGEVVGCAQMEHRQIFPSGDSGGDQTGWHEHDPIEIMTNTKRCIQAVTRELHNRKLDAIGITNQRETTLAWNKVTGVPYYNAIVWDDTRTSEIAKQVSRGNPDRLRSKTGLPITTYFAATKIKWLLDNVPQLREDLQERPAEVYFGTIDTWLVYQLTGTPSMASAAFNCGGLHATDVTNASRWLFLDIKERKWDQSLVDTICAPHKVPLSTLPMVQPSSQIYAILSEKCGIPSLDKVRLASVIGDQQSALFGQTAFAPGEAKNTYGTGLFLMMNTGEKPVTSKHGLLTTIAYQIGNGPTCYALEGSVSHSGSTIQWLRDQLGLIKNFAETEALATRHNDGLYLVPSFAGLFAPHWDSSARGCLVGLTASHTKGHLCRAALEATCYQTKEVFDAIVADSNVELKSLKVDGGGTNNKLMMQFQADIVNVTVLRPKVMETTALGAAFAAGLATGIFSNLEEIKKMWSVAERFEPAFTEEERERLCRGWKKAIDRSKGWVDDDENRSRSVVVPVVQEVVDEIKTSWNFLRTQEGIMLGLVCIGIGSLVGFTAGRQRKI